MKQEKNKVLVIASHPDDEVLGTGGSILKMIDEGAEVYVCIATEAVKSLNFSEEEGKKRRKEAVDASNAPGINKTFFLNMPSVHLDTLPIFEIINKLKEIINEIKPSIVFTHYDNDPNQDHQIISKATIVAANPQICNGCIKEVYFYEIPSSTTNALGDSFFKPNVFLNIDDYIEKKLKILGIYKSEVKKYPHPRSIEGAEIYAKFRGLMCNKKFAEAFMIYRMTK